MSKVYCITQLLSFHGIRISGRFSHRGFFSIPQLVNFSFFARHFQHELRLWRRSGARMRDFSWSSGEPILVHLTQWMVD